MNLLAGLFSSLSGGVQQLIIAALVAVALFGGGYLKGTASVRADIAAEQLKIALAYAGEIVAQQSIADNLTADNEALRAAQAPKDRIITKEITRYAQLTPPAQRCLLPGTFRLLHDAAATGQPPAAGAGAMDADPPVPVEDATVLEIIGENYESCRESAAKLTAWQTRHRTLEAPQ